VAALAGPLNQGRLLQLGKPIIDPGLLAPGGHQQLGDGEAGRAGVGEHGQQPSDVCRRGSWSAHANAMGPGYLYCAGRGFASDDVCTLPMVSCSVGPLVAREGFAREGLWCRAARGGCGSNDLPRQGQQLDPAVVPWATLVRLASLRPTAALVADEAPGTPQPRAGPSGSGHAPEVAAQ
jgi:hypothetical protein